jgi:hypothetical protein
VAGHVVHPRSGGVADDGMWTARKNPREKCQKNRHYLVKNCCFGRIGNIRATTIYHLSAAQTAIPSQQRDLLDFWAEIRYFGAN